MTFTHQQPDNAALPVNAIPVQTVTVNGITIAYKEIGSGYPLVLINGFASTMDTWNPPVLEELARHFRVIIFDNRGTGYSTASGTPFSMSLFAADTLALMDALGIARAHILGHSMGTCVAQELALFHPDRVSRLILVSGTCGGEQMIRMEQPVWETLSDKSGTGIDLANRMFSVLFPETWLETHDPWQYCPEVHETTSEESAAREAEALFSWSGSYDRLPHIRSPVLVITGTEDVVIPPANSRTLADRITGARLVEIPGAGHGLMYQCPGEFLVVVREFLKNVSA
ncbi:MAG: alpha/beta hydrolase [Methanomicrobiales archaeon HGW-Methanomicrobiales-3]|jgi:pimeloyl-ACP methyl ester carboxylesterase|nr:MAG: alpha/beta hydrolase [Methanomicrobiales archaeon HGW-Methanomicrobiales-3]